MEDIKNTFKSSGEPEKKKRKFYYAESQKKYGEKCKTYAIRYVPHELNIADVLDSAISDSGLSAQAWIKSAILDKLEHDGYLKEVTGEN